MIVKPFACRQTPLVGELVEGLWWFDDQRKSLWDKLTTNDIILLCFSYITRATALTFPAIII
ncbi:hypothetical protein CEK71_01600 [Methylovulum psychrotolerans]|uniref:Uncharacterized protein n=1 Tax=Methylovulum psychrotolerans TaxID=1704499 RepID=A0A1Z4BU67_9GAMM|nr:hypothetical protein CEK71_01600 [Methylovulum psychrotolerans]